MPRARQPLDERWFFYQDAQSLWKWARLDLVGTVLAQARQAFDSREACIADAQRSGYGARVADPQPRVASLSRRSRTGDTLPHPRRI